MRFRIVLQLILFIPSFALYAQDIDQLLQEATGNETEYSTATFKSTRIINGHSIERMPIGQLEFRISHRFGQFNSGAYNLWGLDQANIHLGLDYGITNWLMVGIGRGTYEKTFDGSFKFSILKQSKGKRNMPISLSYFTSIAINTLDTTALGIHGKMYFWDRCSFVHQLLVARKFNDRFSLEINPTYVHRNMVNTEMDPNDILSVGAGARFKLTSRISLNAEYYYVIPPIHDYRSAKTYNPLAIGIDIETGGHVFQIMLTNSVAMIEKGFIGETTSKWNNAGIHLGFNISRVFGLKRTE
jgi:opacity protein-like surface antigen